MWHLQVIVGDESAYLNHMNENADADLIPWTKETFCLFKLQGNITKTDTHDKYLSRRGLNGKNCKIEKTQTTFVNLCSWAYLSLLLHAFFALMQGFFKEGIYNKSVYSSQFENVNTLSVHMPTFSLCLFMDLMDQIHCSKKIEVTLKGLRITPSQFNFRDINLSV